MTEGELVDGVVTCPWHGWKFDACTGCGVDPADQRVPTRGVIVQDGNVFVERLHDADPVRPRPVESALLTVREVVDESPDVKTLRLDNASGVFPLHSPGQFLRVAVAIDGTEHVRSFTISSSPTRPEVLEITVKCGPRGLVSKCLHERIRPGDQLAVSGPFGTFCYDAKTHVEPIVLIAAGSGVTPMRSILRTLAATEPDHPCTLIQGARTPADVLFDRESADLVRSNPKLQRFVTLTQPDASWTRDAGRIDLAYISKCVLQPALCRYFLCGPDRFMEELRAGLMSLGVPSDRLHMEDFQSRPAAVTAS